MGATGEPVRVLHVDDEPEFADLAATFLERESDRLTVETATSAAEGLDLLDETVDCVVSDYEMPGRDGIEFLRTVRQSYPDLPFILFTGRGSEAVASEAISAGVTDYLQKGGGTEQYELLANRIGNTVAQARAERAARTERRRARVLFERLTQPAVEVAYESDAPVVKQVNPAFEETFGYDADAVVGSRLGAYIVPEGRGTAATRLAEHIREGEGGAVEEVSRQTADGEREFLLQPAVYDDGSGGFGIYTDITDRKRREQRLERQNTRLATLFEHLPEPTVAYSYESGEPHIRAVNEAFVDVFGYPAERAVGEPVDDLIVPPERRAEAARIDDRVDAGELVDEVLRRETRSGVRTFRFRNIRLPDDPEIDGYGIYADVSERPADTED